VVIRVRVGHDDAFDVGQGVAQVGQSLFQGGARRGGARTDVNQRERFALAVRQVDVDRPHGKGRGDDDLV
jgi:hypothetical protein